MHRLGAHTNIFTLDDILEIKYLDVEFQIDMVTTAVRR